MLNESRRQRCSTMVYGNDYDEFFNAVFFNEGMHQYLYRYQRAHIRRPTQSEARREDRCYLSMWWRKWNVLRWDLKTGNVLHWRMSCGSSFQRGGYCLWWSVLIADSFETRLRMCEIEFGVSPVGDGINTRMSKFMVNHVVSDNLLCQKWSFDYSIPYDCS